MIDDEDEIDNGTESSISKALESRRQCEQLLDEIPSSEFEESGKEVEVDEDDNDKQNTKGKELEMPKSIEEVEVESIFQSTVLAVLATSDNLCKRLIEHLIEKTISYKEFKIKHPMYEIVQNCRSRYATQLSSGVKLKWFGLDYKKELERTLKNSRSYFSKVQMMSAFMRKIKDGLLESEKSAVRNKLEIISKKIFWSDHIGVRFMCSSKHVFKPSELNKSRVFKLYIKKKALTTKNVLLLEKTDNNPVSCFHQLLEVISTF